MTKYIIAGSILLPIIAFAAMTFRVYLNQEKMIYYPRAYTEVELSLLEMKTEEVSFHTSQGEQYAYFVKRDSTEPPRRLWLLFHGNASLAADWLPYLGDEVASSEDAFLLIDYPGYGQNRGESSPAAIAENTLGALEAVRDRYHLTSAKNGLIGYSLGAAAALQRAAVLEAEKIFLFAPFTSLQEVACRVLSRPFCYALTHHFDNRGALQQLYEEIPEAQVFMVYGDADQLIPPEMGEELKELYPDLIRLRIIRGADHETLLGGARGYLAKFLNSSLPD